MKTYKILGPSVSARIDLRSTLEPACRDWRECCAAASARLTRAYYVVSLLTDFDKVYKRDSYIVFVSLEDLQDFRYECRSPRALSQHSNQHC